MVEREAIHADRVVLLNIPVPPVYLAEDDYGIYSVIDGKQRITATRDFMSDGFALSKLEDLSDLEGRRYKELPRELANALRVRPYIRAITLLRQSDPELKYEVFQRLNTGGEPLNPQEIRNVAFRGPLNDLIYRLAGAQFLRQQLKIRSNTSPSYRNMLDAEFVLRFLTLSESWRSFSGDFRKSMDRFMAAHRSADAATLNSLEARFTKALTWCEVLWGTHAFQRPVPGGWRDQALAGMYDAQMVAVASLPETNLKALRPAQVRSATRHLFNDDEFEIAVRVVTNTPRRIRYRISELTKRLTDLADGS